MISRFFPDAQRVSAAREFFSNGSYGDLSRVMGSGSLGWPHNNDILAVLDEFDDLAATLGLIDDDASFMVLIPVRVNGSILTTPVLIDLDRRELAFTSHPALGASVISDHVIADNPTLAWELREELLAVLATWHNQPVEDRPQSA
jgi:hypothetical protein